MTKEQACAIADVLLADTLGMRIASDSATYRGGQSASWVITYPRPTEKEEMTDPSHFIVIVSVADRKAAFFPVL